MRRTRALAICLLVAGCQSRPKEIELRPVGMERAVFSAPGQQVRFQGVTTYFGGQIPLFVGGTGQPQILHLSSFYPAIWRVYLLPGADVRRVYLSGFEAQRIKFSFSRLDNDPRTPVVIDLGTNLKAHETLSFSPPVTLHPDPRDPAGSIEDYQREIEKVSGGYRLTDFSGRDKVPFGNAVRIGGALSSRWASVLNQFDIDRGRDGWGSALRDFHSATQDVRRLIAKGRIPARFEVSSRPPNAPSSWSILPAEAPPKTIPKAQVSLYPSECGAITLGSSEGDMLLCGGGPWGYASTRWMFAGPGSDIIYDYHEKDQFIDAGKGDDIINPDVGHELLFFGAHWGHDMVTFRFPEVTSYVVFGRGVRPADLYWVKPRLLRNRRTGDTIEFETDLCAKVVTVEEGNFPEPPESEIEDLRC